MTRASADILTTTSLRPQAGPTQVTLSQVPNPQKLRDDGKHLLLFYIIKFRGLISYAAIDNKYSS